MKRGCNKKTINKSSLDRIIESIAKEEEAIAKIMRAEACKIKKVTRCTNSAKNIKDINDSARKTIQELIKLNMILQFKLETVKDIKCKNC